jgi:hypothetical protein
MKSKWESNNYSGGGKNPTVSWNETAKSFVLTLLSICKIILQKASFLEEESYCVNIVNNEETYFIKWTRFSAILLI